MNKKNGFKPVVIGVSEGNFPQYCFLMDLQDTSREQAHLMCFRQPLLHLWKRDFVQSQALPGCHLEESFEDSYARYLLV